MVCSSLERERENERTGLRCTVAAFVWQAAVLAGTFGLVNLHRRRRSVINIIGPSSRPARTQTLRKASGCSMSHSSSSASVQILLLRASFCFDNFREIRSKTFSSSKFIQNLYTIIFHINRSIFSLLNENCSAAICKQKRRV